MSSTPVILYVLDCQHLIPLPSWWTHGNFHCIQCHKTRAIVGVHPEEWRMRCRKCHRSTFCGMAKEMAQHYANVHSARTRHPSIAVEYVPNPTAVKVQEKLNAIQR